MLIKIPNCIDFISITASNKIKKYTINKKASIMNLGKTVIKKSLILPYVIKLPSLLITSKDKKYLYGNDAVDRYLNTITLSIVTKDNEDYNKQWLINLISGE